MATVAATAPRVVIIGGGFGGLRAARALKHAPVRVTLIDKQNHHTFQPLLYQVATAALVSTDVAFPLRSLHVEGKRPEPFHYLFKGELATIGRSRAVAKLPAGIKLPGFIAWVMYLTVHLVYLCGFRTRILVFLKEMFHGTRTDDTSVH